MGKLHDAILVLGEGPTEFYYFNSLRDILKGISIKPDYPKHTNLKELDKKIQEGISKGYNKIFCIIDMDTKGIESESSQYFSLKTKYLKPIIDDKEGVNCTIKFIETHRCTETFFLYYFKYTTHYYSNQKELIRDLNYCCLYAKTEDFFRKSKGLHSYFEKNGGSIQTAIKNANKSLKTKDDSHSYSELGVMLTELMNN